MLLKMEEVMLRLKEWKCVVVGHHDNVGKTIEEWEKAGWRLHSYQTAGMGGAVNYTVNHYLLFVKGE
jgi:hypothetical protein